MADNDTIGVYRVRGQLGYSYACEYLQHTVCVSKSNTFIDDGIEIILETYVSTALTTSISLLNKIAGVWNSEFAAGDHMILVRSEAKI